MAVIVGVPTLVELVIVAVYVKLALAVTAPTLSAASLDVNATVVPVTGLPLASVTVAVAVLLAVPSATIDVGDSVSATFPALPAVCVRVA